MQPERRKAFFVGYGLNSQGLWKDEFYVMPLSKLRDVPLREDTPPSKCSMMHHRTKTVTVHEPLVFPCRERYLKENREPVADGTGGPRAARPVVLDADFVGVDHLLQPIVEETMRVSQQRLEEEVLNMPLGQLQ